MGRVTFQVLDGLERGEIYRDLAPPVSIGREEENHIRLNDERVSRFHAKVQEHDGQFILTDLDSTNGTRVNGHPIHMHVLQIGDQVLIGRCLLLFGSPESLAELAGSGEESEGTLEILEGHVTESGNVDCPDLFREPPTLPRGLSPIQTAQSSDVLAYLHTSLLRSLYSVQGAADSENPLKEVVISSAAWHRLQRLQMDLATYLKKISEPDA
jgi:pSer/pThr/pTyr-binding forkhead associated (FHA) protein